MPIENNEIFIFSLPWTCISFSCSKRETQSLLMIVGPLLRRNQPPHNKVIHAQGSAIQLGCVKYVDAYGNLNLVKFRTLLSFMKPS